MQRSDEQIIRRAWRQTEKSNIMTYRYKNQRQAVSFVQRAFPPQLTLEVHMWFYKAQQRVKWLKTTCTWICGWSPYDQHESESEDTVERSKRTTSESEKRNINVHVLPECSLERKCCETKVANARESMQWMFYFNGIRGLISLIPPESTILTRNLPVSTKSMFSMTLLILFSKSWKNQCNLIAHRNCKCITVKGKSTVLCCPQATC